MNPQDRKANDHIELGINFLYSGWDNEKWSISQVWTKDFWTFCQAVDKMAAIVSSRSFDAFCALRGSGAPIGALLSYELSKPFFWFVDASDHSLFPRHKPIKGLRMLLIDSHIITGGNMTRHIEILRRNGVQVESACVFLDCDQLRDESAAQRIRKRIRTIDSLWMLSELVPHLASRAQSDERVRTFYELISTKGRVFWRPPRDS